MDHYDTTNQCLLTFKISFLMFLQGVVQVISLNRFRLSGFPIIHKAGNVVIFVLLT